MLTYKYINIYTTHVGENNVRNDLVAMSPGRKKSLGLLEIPGVQRRSEGVATGGPGHTSGS